MNVSDCCIVVKFVPKKKGWTCVGKQGEVKRQDWIRLKKSNVDL